jgi:hypothetical protein
MDMREKARPTYTVRRAKTTPELQGEWTGPAWRDAEALSISHFHEQSADHRPATHAKAVYDDQGMYLIFDVLDRYVRCVHTGFQSAVWKDSCVEFFVAPASGIGYFNFEFNCGGSLLVSHVTDATRTPTGLKKAAPLTRDQINGLRIWHSLPARIENELTQPTPWTLEAFIPWRIFDSFGTKNRLPAGEIWHANFYKCGDETSHPHWAAWADIASDLNFHQPAYFGAIRFE